MRSSSTLAALLLVLVLGEAREVGAQGVEPGHGADFHRIDSVVLSERSDGAELEIVTTGPVKWSIRDQGDGEVVVRLRDCLPGPELPEIIPKEGLVEAVEVGSFGESVSPETRVAIRTREKIKYRVTVGEQNVTVVLIAREPMPPTEAAPAPEPAAVSDLPSEAPPPEMPSMEPVLTEMEPVLTEPSEGGASMSDAAGVKPGGLTRETFDRQAGEYRIGPGDVLNIDVFGLDEMDRKVRVQTDGKISLPILGAFTVGDLNLEDAERLIAGMLKDRRLVRDPQVLIFVEELVSRAVSVQGAVVSPGVYQLISDKTLLEIIGEAGGLREDSGNRVLVLRTESGSERKMELDLEALTAGGDLALNVSLLPGDIVMVPFSRLVTVYVTGAVANPGPVQYQSSEGITVLQAITAAGGQAPRANLRNVHVLRKQPGGEQQKIKINIKMIQSGKVDDLVLEKNDTVVVGEWFF